MRATEVLQKCLRDALGSMHALRSRVLLRAVEAMIQGPATGWLALVGKIQLKHHGRSKWQFSAVTLG